MRAVLLFCLAALGLAAGETAEPALDYHDTIGIPLAAKIKAAEEAIFMKTETDVDEFDSTGRIVGGAAAPANMYPYLAGLLIHMWGISGVSACGSSLLSANRLVTAAHCWLSTNHIATRFEVVLGSRYLFFGGTRISSSNVVMHPAYVAAALVNDVAIIYLPHNVIFSQSIQPINLPATAQIGESFAGWLTVAAGYGKTSDQQQGVSQNTEVMHVQVQVITNAQCQAVFGGWVTTGNICTNGAGGVGVCGGDSGGPLVAFVNGQPTLVGISSFVAAAGCQLGFPSAYARVTSFYSFIISHLQAR